MRLFGMVAPVIHPATRSAFIFATLLTAGGFSLVYIAMAFILPISPTRESPHMGRR
jgi:phage shock protein PspC (stress-responsive transcriptional regulator)